MMKIAFNILLIFCSSSTFALDLGVIGEVVPIRETNVIELLKERANSISSESKDRMQVELRKTYETKLTNPSPFNLPETINYSVHYFDPKIRATHEIKDTAGNIIVKRGASHNPLESHPLSGNLLFFNGDDPEQVVWANERKGVWILVKGKVLDLEVLENRPVFFDQGGVLCKKFGIRSVPSKVSQYESTLKVELIPKGAR